MVFVQKTYYGILVLFEKIYGNTVIEILVPPLCSMHIRQCILQQRHTPKVANLPTELSNSRTATGQWEVSHPPSHTHTPLDAGPDGLTPMIQV